MGWIDWLELCVCFVCIESKAHRTKRKIGNKTNDCNIVVGMCFCIVKSVFCFACVFFRVVVVVVGYNIRL